MVKSEAERMAELRQMAEIMAALWKERAAHPPTFDLISMMAHGEATRAMPLNEFIGNFALLIVGGNDTTRNSMTGGLIAALENPGEIDKVRSDKSLLPSLVSEIIRWQTPVIHMRRTATRDVELVGKAIKKGDKVVMWYVSGNRDEAAIDDPEAFRVGRPRARHHLSSAPVSIAASATGWPSCSSRSCGRRCWHAISGSKSRGCRSGSIRIHPRRPRPAGQDFLIVSTPAAKACCSNHTSPAIETKS